MQTDQRPVLINCPITEYPVDTRYRADSVEGFDNMVIRCPECGEDHVWGREDAWLESASS